MVEHPTTTLHQILFKNWQNAVFVKLHVHLVRTKWSRSEDFVEVLHEQVIVKRLLYILHDSFRLIVIGGNVIKIRRVINMAQIKKYKLWAWAYFLLTHYNPVLLFYTPWKHQKTFRFPDVFRGYRKATPGCNGLNTSTKFFPDSIIPYMQ